jgi:D-alanine transfer protein
MRVHVTARAEGERRLELQLAAPHVLAAWLAIVFVAAALNVFTLYAQAVERRYVHALAPTMFRQKTQGTAIQYAALHEPDLLLLFGSSELLHQENPYHPSNLFANYADGFTVFPVGTNGSHSLLMLENLAALGSELRGKQVAIILSSPWFVSTGTLPKDRYDGAFGRLYAYELAFSTELSVRTKQAVARRMLQYPDTLEHDPVLRFALEQLADGSPASRVLYVLTFPIGKLAGLLLRLQDHWATLVYIVQQPDLDPEVPRGTAALDWPSLRARGAAEYLQHSHSNPFGIDDRVWAANPDLARRKNDRSDDGFIDTFRHGKETSDLRLLLQVLQELDAAPLLLEIPVFGRYYDFLGVSPAARAAFYEHIRRVASDYGVPLLDFADHDEDRAFQTDPSAHPSEKGWVYYDQALDTFYHRAPR